MIESDYSYWGICDDCGTPCTDEGEWDMEWVEDEYGTLRCGGCNETRS